MPYYRAMFTSMPEHPQRTKADDEAGPEGADSWSGKG